MAELNHDDDQVINPAPDNTVTGPVGGNVFQARDISGDVNVHWHGPSATLRLPEPTGTYFCYCRDLDTLTKSTETGRAVVVAVSGPRASQTVLHWANRRTSSFPGGQLYVDPHGMHDREQHVTALAVIRRVVADLRVPPPPVPEDLLTTYRRLIAQRRVLLVINHADSVEDLATLLPGAGPSVLVAVSQERLATVIPGRTLILQGPSAAARTLALLPDRDEYLADIAAAPTTIGFLTAVIAVIVLLLNHESALTTTLVTAVLAAATATVALGVTLVVRFARPLVKAGPVVSRRGIHLGQDHLVPWTEVISIGAVEFEVRDLCPPLAKYANRADERIAVWYIESTSDLLEKRQARNLLSRRWHEVGCFGLALVTPQAGRHAPIPVISDSQNNLAKTITPYLPCRLSWTTNRWQLIPKRGLPSDR